MENAVYFACKKGGLEKSSGRKGFAHTKATSAACKFLLEDVICCYGFTSQITIDGGELDADEVQEIFSCIGVNLDLTTTYRGNGKSE